MEAARFAANYNFANSEPGIEIDPATGKRVYRDAKGRQIPDALEVDGNSIYNPTLDAYSPSDIARLEKQGAERAAVVGGIGALGDAAALAATMVPTAADLENTKRLKELDKHKGLSSAERSEIDEQAMRGVRTLGAEVQRSMGDDLAASGQHSAAALQRARRAGMDAMNTAAIRAGDIGIRENREQVQRDRIEEQERIAQKAKRDNEGRKVAVEAVTGLLKAIAPAMAAQSVKTEPTDAQLVQLASLKKGNDLAYPGLQGETDPVALRQLYRAMVQDTRPKWFTSTNQAATP